MRALSGLFAIQRAKQGSAAGQRLPKSSGAALSSSTPRHLATSPCLKAQRHSPIHPIRAYGSWSGVTCRRQGGKAEHCSQPSCTGRMERCWRTAVDSAKDAMPGGQMMPMRHPNKQQHKHTNIKPQNLEP